MVRSSRAAVFSKSWRLRFTSDSSSGIERIRVRTSFRFRDSKGCPIRDKVVLERIRVLAIPPAWEQVWICSRANGHLQATGRDARGRKQYLYHPAFRSK
jgi:DNA topoisomerase-1